MHTSEVTLEITADSPCIGHCTTVLGDDVCRSCLRTFDEVTRWLEMNEAERMQVNQRIALCSRNNDVAIIHAFTCSELTTLTLSLYLQDMDILCSSSKPPSSAWSKV